MGKRKFHFRIPRPSQFVPPTQLACKTVTEKQWTNSGTFDVKKVNCESCKKTDAYKEAKAK